MRKVLVSFCLIFCMSALSSFSQNVISLGDKLLTANNMGKVSQIIKSGGMVIEPVEEMFGIDPDLRITASNGVDAQIPIMCTVHAISKTDRRIQLISFVYKGDASKLKSNLSNLGYKYVDEFEYNDYGHILRCKRYLKGDRICVISTPTNGEKVSTIDFTLRGQ